MKQSFNHFSRPTCSHASRQYSICPGPWTTSFFPEVQEVFHKIQRISFPSASKMESNSNSPSYYQNYKGNVNSVMSAISSADSNSNGTLNSTLHLARGSCSSQHSSSRNNRRPCFANNCFCQSSSWEYCPHRYFSKRIHVYSSTWTTANQSPENAHRNARPRKPSTAISSDLP